MRLNYYKLTHIKTGRVHRHIKGNVASRVIQYSNHIPKLAETKRVVNGYRVEMDTPGELVDTSWYTVNSYADWIVTCDRIKAVMK